jgi:hypothetical protein
MNNRKIMQLCPMSRLSDCKRASNGINGQKSARASEADMLEKRFGDKDQRIDELEDLLRSSNDKAHELELMLIGKDQHINELDSMLRSSNEQVQELECIIADIQQSILCQLLIKYQTGFVDRLFPHGTGRKERYDLSLKCARSLCNEGWSGFRKSCVNFHGDDNFNSAPSEDEASSSLKGIDIFEKEVLVHHQVVSTEITSIEACVGLKKGNNLIRFHISERCKQPTDIPELKSEDEGCSRLSLREISIRAGSAKFSIDYHSNEDSDEGTLCWLSDDAAMVVNSLEDCNARLVIKASSPNHPRMLKIYIKNVMATSSFRKYAGKKFVPLNGAEIRADKNLVKNEVDDILNKLESENLS